MSEERRRRSRDHARDTEHDEGDRVDGWIRRAHVLFRHRRRL